jgi:hypothetical protein
VMREINRMRPHPLTTVNYCNTASLQHPMTAHSLLSVFGFSLTIESSIAGSAASSAAQSVSIRVIVAAGLYKKTAQSAATSIHRSRTCIRWLLQRPHAP